MHYFLMLQTESAYQRKFENEEKQRLVERIDSSISSFFRIDSSCLRGLHTSLEVLIKIHSTKKNRRDFFIKNTSLVMVWIRSDFHRSIAKMKMF